MYFYVSLGYVIMFGACVLLFFGAGVAVIIIIVGLFADCSTTQYKILYE